MLYISFPFALVHNEQKSDVYYNAIRSKIVHPHQNITVQQFTKLNTISEFYIACNVIFNVLTYCAILPEHRSPRSFLNSFLLPSWRAVRSYRPHLEERDPIWGDDWQHSLFIRWSPSWGFLGFSSAVKKMPGDLYTAPRIISLSSLSLATDVTDMTLGASGSWLRTLTGAGCTAGLAWIFFGPSLWPHERKNKLLKCILN